MFLFSFLRPGECPKVDTCIIFTVAFVPAISLLLLLQLSLLFSLVSLTHWCCFSALSLLTKDFLSLFVETEPFCSSSVVSMTFLSCFQGRRWNLGLLVYFLRCCLSPLLTRYALTYLLFISQFQFWPF